MTENQTPGRVTPQQIRAEWEAERERLLDWHYSQSWRSDAQGMASRLILRREALQRAGVF